jgi:hypothetical protein
MNPATNEERKMTLLERNVIPFLLIAAAAFLFACRTPIQDEGRVFSDPGAASAALVSALQLSDEDKLLMIVGPDAKPVLTSGDPVMDQHQRTWFINAYEAKNTWIPWNTGVMVLEVGPRDWPFPIPLVKQKGTWWGQKAGWTFDTAEGAGELLNRRIGRNELDTIQSSLAFVDAQREYFQRNAEQSAQPEYARFILSTKGKRNGLYWETTGDEPPSPLGSLYAEAQSAGYSPTQAGGKPYHGYLYKILDAQGSSAPGGAYSYLVDGRMTQGFALLTFPAKYGASGVMSFVVNQVGLVYQKDLGPDTREQGAKIESFDPDMSWQLVSLAAQTPPGD